MILITTGTGTTQFVRLLRIIDNLCDKGILNGNEIVAQIGKGNYIPRNYRYYEMIPRKKFMEYLKESTLVITHSGTGSVVPAVKLGKKVIVFPRLEKFHEHLDNNQLELANEFNRLGYTLKSTNQEELEECILNINNFIPKKYTSSEKISELIINFIRDCDFL